MLLNTASFNTSIQPAIEVALMLGSKRQFSKMKAGFQLGYLSSVFEGSANTTSAYSIVKEEYNHKFNLLRFSLVLNYILNPLDKCQFYIDPSISLYNVLGNDLTGTTIQTYAGGWQNTRTDYPEFNKNFVSFGLGTGVISGSHRLALKGDYSSDNADAKMETTSISSIRLSLSYHYRLFNF